MKRDRKIADERVEKDWEGLKGGISQTRHKGGVKNAARCMCQRSALHHPSQHAAPPIAPPSLFSLTIKQDSELPYGGGQKRRSLAPYNFL